MSPSETDAEFEALLEHLKRSRGFDFTGYKRASLMRRVQRRMNVVGVEGFTAYMEHLEFHPGEFAALFDTILINVTSFFRDPDAWHALSDRLLPELLARKPADHPVRVWSAACASGQETYTAVMVLAEAMGETAFRERVKVYASDVDEAALAQARSATYAEREMEGLPVEMRDKYFDASPRGWTFRSDLRRQVIFGRHDLVQDAPISHLDLLICRNALMYFNAEAQARILARFHFALNPDALLFLGKAEMMRAQGHLFAPADLKARIFTRRARATLRDRLVAIGDGSRHQAPPPEPAGPTHLREAALDAEPMAQVAVDAAGSLALVNACARELFGLTPADLGRPLQDLKLSYHPADLRSPIEHVMAERRPVTLPGVEHHGRDGAPRVFDVELVPLADPRGHPLGVSVTFTDVTRSRGLQSELESANHELETAYEELQSTNEELETMNEELQSTIEELETTNEELQSTNEELETMNEELQSTNEELETLNDELRRRTDELNGVNAYTASILASLRSGVVVLDRDLRVRVWNRKAEDLWGLRADEVTEQPLLNLDVGLPVERLKAPLRACLEGQDEYQEVHLEAVNRRGRAIVCRVTCAPLTGRDREVSGAILLMEEWGDAVRS